MGWVQGAATDYEPAYALDLPQPTAFIEAMQPDLMEPLSLHAATPTRHEFLSRLPGEITKNGVVSVLRRGIDHRQHHVDGPRPIRSEPSPTHRSGPFRYGDDACTPHQGVRGYRELSDWPRNRAIL